MAGYSGTPLLQKLGIDPDTRVRVCRGPPHFLRDVIGRGYQVPGLAEVILFFSRDRYELRTEFSRARDFMLPDAALWVCWPKKTSAFANSGLDENVVRKFVLARKLVDVKVCAIDGDWSGLKFVVPVEDRPAFAKRRRKKPDNG